MKLSWEKVRKCLVLTAWSFLLFGFRVFLFPGCFVSAELLRSCMFSWNRKGRALLSLGSLLTNSPTMCRYCLFASVPDVGLCLWKRVGS